MLHQVSLNAMTEDVGQTPGSATWGTLISGASHWQERGGGNCWTIEIVQVSSQRLAGRLGWFGWFRESESIFLTRPWLL